MAVLLANAIDLFMDTTKVNEIKDITISVEIQTAQVTSLTTEWTNNLGGTNALKEWTADVTYNYDEADAGQALLAPDTEFTSAVHFTLENELTTGAQELIASDGAVVGAWSHNAAEGGNSQQRTITLRGKGPLVEQAVP